MSDEKTPTDPAPALMPTNTDIMHALSGLVERFDGFETAVIGLRQTVGTVADDQSKTRSLLEHIARDLRADMREVKGKIVTIQKRLDRLDGGDPSAASANGSAE